MTSATIDLTTLSGTELRTEILKIRDEMNLSVITVEQAEANAQPYIDEMNRRADAIAKEYGKKHKPFRFGTMMR